MKKDRRHSGREAGEPAEPIEDTNGSRMLEEPETSPDAEPSRVAELEGEVEALRGKYLRALADLDNHRKRVERERADLSRYACEGLITNLLDVLDGFDRAIALDPGEVGPEGFLEGLDLLRRRFVEVLEKEGVVAVEAVGRPFDPHLHEAVMEVEADGAPSGTVVQELRKGYRLHDRLLRPSKVTVAK